MTMRERIAAGKLFTDGCEGLPLERVKCKVHMNDFNLCSPTDVSTRKVAMRKLFGRETNACIESPFFCHYGSNIIIGDNSYISFNCNFVDDGKITIGKRVICESGVTIVTVGHPISPDIREYMYTDPVTIEDNCYIGAGAIICPGVTIGENCVINAGSVVTHDIPKNSVAAGNPCQVIREINEKDKEFYYKDRPILEDDLEEERKLRESK